MGYFGAVLFVVGAGSGVHALFQLRELGREFRRRPGAAHLLPLVLGSPAATPSDLVVAHWSDLHLTPEDDDQNLEGGGGGNQALRLQIERYRDVLDRAGLILITGDVTDSGRPAEWRKFFEILPKSLRAKAILLPGNHDLNITDVLNPSLAEGSDALMRKVRIIRMMAALDHIQGTRARTLTSNGELATLRAALLQHAVDLRRFIRDPPRRSFEVRGGGQATFFEDVTPPEILRLIELPERVWGEIFPMVLEVANGRLLIFVLDSNDAASNIAENAFGRIAPASLARLALLQRRYENRNAIYLLHHHVAPPPVAVSWKSSLQSRFLTLVNADEFLSAVGDRQTVVFHGHRHVGFHGRLDDVVEIIAAPSTTLGDDASPCGPGFYLFGLRLAAAAGAQVVWAQWHGLRA